MNRMRLLYFLAGVVLAGIGLASEAKDSHYAHTQANTIVSTDQAASSAGTAAAISNLQAFVKTHMGTSVSFSLTGSYNRAVTASQVASRTQAANANVYAAAQAACSGKTDSLVQARCNEAYLQAHLQAASPTPAATPKMADYQYNFKAPWWNPDLAGALLLGALFAFALLIISLLKPRRSVI